MIHIVCFSGGKDSTATVLWAKANLPSFRTVFCDTGWEHPITLAYVEQINQALLGGTVEYLRSDEYEDLLDCMLDHQMFPTGAARFCAEDMKIAPLHALIEAQEDEVTTYQGVRADESVKRAQLRDYEWVSAAGGYAVERPILHWSARQVFAYLKSHGVEPNPLYKMGLSRVGCWPCILVNLRDMKAYLESTPEIRPRLIEAEEKMFARTGKQGRHFFPAGFIPERFCSIQVTSKRGRVVHVPSASDVFAYLDGKTKDQFPMFPARSCMSVYNLCE